MTIFLREIWPVKDLADYKLHFARWNGHDQPLDVWVRDKEEWQGWQEYRPGRDDFNRPYIFSVAQFYHEADIWLFGGVFRVLARHDDQYEVELTKIGASFNGRLKLRYAYKDRATRANFENHYPHLEVQEILREPYAGRSFPGFENIDVSFAELETLVRIDRPDWKSALENIKGVYLITDIKTGKRYVGAAHGEQGVWSRWCAYVATGHGGNVDLRALIDNSTLEYCRLNFRFALLEQLSSKTPDELVINRESFWKRVLLSRGEQGLNRN